MKSIDKTLKVVIICLLSICTIYLGAITAKKVLPKQEAHDPNEATQMRISAN